MTDYKETLNLPQTPFPMKANLPQREPEILNRWQTLGLYQQLRQSCQPRPRFVLHDGPPYANGRPHLGTALNKILKDMVVKSKTLSGYDAPYVPGWDCHGLPIELNVEKKVGKPGQKLSAKQFRQACREYAYQQIALQSNDFQRLGVIGDWEQPYLTMNFKYEADTVRALARIIAKGHLHRGQKPVHWCTLCHSALAEAEVEYRDKTSPAIDVAFKVIEKQKIADLFKIEIENEVIVPIWTTTPWTLPANQAVAFNPTLEYTLIKATWEQKTVLFIVVEALIETVMQRYQIENYTVLGTKTGQLFEYIQLQHPFLDRQVPILLGHHVTTEVGTGAVHTAPAHGLDDYELGMHYQLPVINPVNGESCFAPETPVVAGMNVFAANDKLIEHLRHEGALLHVATLNHSYPHCWRHKTPLIFRATPQWFISMEQQGLREQTLTAINQVSWLPSWGRARIEGMINSRPDWCISRQRAWGIPIALFVHKHTQAIHPRTPELMEAVAEKIETEGIDAWFDLPIEQLLKDEATDYYKVNDVLDVWFDSGVSHACVLEKRPELYVPADLYLEGSDQHRGWFQTSLLTSIAMREEAPYKTVLTHGYVVDGKGFKMSKSLGNVIAPDDVVKKLGADVLRLWAAALDHRNDINVSDEILQRSADTYRRIRNTARFLLANLHDFLPEEHMVPAEQLLALDRWAILLAESLQKEIIEAYQQYQFPLIFQKIHHFCNIQLGSFYLDVIKDRQYTAKRDGLPRRSAQTALYYIAESLVRWLAPILSFTAEEIWQYLPGNREPSVFLTTWFTAFPIFTQGKQDELAYWNGMIQVRDEVNKILEEQRKIGRLGSGLEAEVTLYANHQLFSDLAQLGNELRFVLITSQATVKPFAQATHSALKTAMPDLLVEVSIAEQPKCVRCWQRRADVGNNHSHPELCARCVENVVGIGEQRWYA